MFIRMPALRLRRRWGRSFLSSAGRITLELSFLNWLVIMGITTPGN